MRKERKIAHGKRKTNRKKRRKDRVGYMKDDWLTVTFAAGERLMGAGSLSGSYHTH